MGQSASKDAFLALAEQHASTVAARDEQLRARLGADKAGYCIAQATKACTICGVARLKPEFASNQWKKSEPTCLRCKCVYCNQYCRLGHKSKEHLLPRSVGGTLTVTACRDCNGARGHSGSYKPFRQYITAFPDVWARALNERSQNKGNELLEWLKMYDLLEESLVGLLMSKNV